MKNINGLLIIAILLLSGCASVPKPPHCNDTATDLKPINSTSDIRAN